MPLRNVGQAASLQAQGKPCFLPETPSLWCVERCLSPYHSDDWQIWLDDHNASCNATMPMAAIGAE